MANLLYIVVYTSDKATPTNAQIVAGLDATGAAALYAISLTKETSGDEVVDTTAVLSGGASYKLASVWYDGTSYSNVGESVAWTQDSNQSAVTAGISVPVGIGAASLSPGAASIADTGVSIAVGVGSASLDPGAVSAASIGVSVQVGIGSPTVTAVVEGIAQPAGVSVAVGIGAPTLNPGSVSAATAGVSVSVGIGSATITSFAQLLASGAGINVGIGSPTIAVGAAQILPDEASIAIGIGAAQAYLIQQYAETDGVELDIGIGGAALTGGAIWTTISAASSSWVPVADTSTTWTEI